MDEQPRPIGYRRRKPEREPFERREIAIAIGLVVYGLAWGLLYKHFAPYGDAGSLIPTGLILIGPIAIIGYVGRQVLVGELGLRPTWLNTIAFAVGLFVGAQALPSPLPAVNVTGAVTGTLDGVAVDANASCTWGIGRDAVTFVKFAITPRQGAPTNYFSQTLPAGTFVIDLEDKSIYAEHLVTADPQAIPQPTLAFAAGGTTVDQPASAGSRAADASKGAIHLDAGPSVPAADLAWTCDPAPTR